MAIVKMKKFKLFTLERNRENLLKELQMFKYVHFIKTKNDENYPLEVVQSSKDILELKEKSQKIKWTLSYFAKFFPKKYKEALSDTSPLELPFIDLEKQAKTYDFDHDYEILSSNNREIEKNKEELVDIELKEKELANWLSIQEPIKTLKNFEKVKIILGYVPKKFLDNLKSNLEKYDKVHIEEVSTLSNTVNLMIICSNLEEKTVRNLLKTNNFSETNFNFNDTFSNELEKINIRKKELETLNKDLEQINEKLLEKLSKLRILDRYVDNLLLRGESLGKFKKTETVDIIEGYIPNDMEEGFKIKVQEISNQNSYLEILEVDENDANIPILLKNSKLTDLFSSITQMYALPRYNEVDPTPILSIFYWVFFGMMVADFAYGLILCLVSGCSLIFLKLKENTRKFLKFFFALSFSTMLWGLAYGSAFGDLIKLPTQIIDSSKDFMSILILSVIFGAVHLAVGLGIKAYILIKNGNIMDAVYDVFLWYLTLISLIVLILSKQIGLTDFVKNIFLIASIIGMLGIIAFGARDAKTLVGRIGGGFYSLYGITSYIGDFVSYLRLMALGLAGGFIAVAINIIVKMLVGGGVFGIIAGVIVFAFGQSFNIFLSFLSAYVHTSRLMYVEFFSKFYEGGGKEFKKFQI